MARLVARLSVASSIPPQFLLDPALPPGFFELMLEEYIDLNPSE